LTNDIFFTADPSVSTKDRLEQMVSHSVENCVIYENVFAFYVFCL